jgi:helix-turn-helix protein
VKIRNEDYYTINRILDIIKNYHINIENIKEFGRDIKSVGVAQYGIESTLPRGNEISSVVEREVVRQLNQNVFIANMITDIKYVQQRWHRVTNEKEAQVLSLRLSGHKAIDIATILGMERTNVYRLLNKVAHSIKGYPQNNATNSTNYENEKVLVYN